MGVSLPEGASASTHGVNVPPHRRIGLIAADGLEMTYGPGNYFVAAPDSVGMSRGSKTLVRFRDPVSHDEASLTLVPEVIRARVEMGPKTASWPGDHVAINVILVDGEDQPLDSTDGVEARVSVNLKPVATKWTRKGNTLSARVVQTKSTPGPWVVRVEISHETLGHLARDFLEVTKAE
jgi:hypothetical protein